MAYSINLTHRGPQVISNIDLFDECHYGADKHFFRGGFDNPAQVADQVKIALGDKSLIDTEYLTQTYPEFTTENANSFYNTKLGIGNPLEQMTTDDNGNITSPTISLNRWHIPNKKFWNNAVPMDVINPYKANYAVSFTIRIYFHDDYGYITFGCPWSEIKDALNETETSSSITTGTDLIPHFKLLKCHFISKEDSIQVLKSLGLEVDEWDGAIPSHATEATMLLDLVDEDGSQIQIG